MSSPITRDCQACGAPFVPRASRRDLRSIHDSDLVCPDCRPDRIGPGWKKLGGSIVWVFLAFATVGFSWLEDIRDWIIDDDAPQVIATDYAPLPLLPKNRSTILPFPLRSPAVPHGS